MKSLALVFVAAISAGCGTVTADPSDSGATGTGGMIGSSNGGAASSTGGDASSTGGVGSGGSGGTHACGANPICSDGACGSDNGDPKHCGVSCQVCPSGQACINSACVYPSCDTVLPAPVMYNQGCSPAGSIVSKDGYDCFSACQYSQSVLPTTTECTFKNPITGPGASGLALCVLACSECS